jgi:hypothetical protein
MKRISAFNSARAAFTLVELTVAAGAGLILIGILASASVGLQRTISATSQSATAMNNETRLLDYVAQDLRRAVRVGTITSGSYATAKNVSSFSVTETAILAINIPDYYGSNSPNNAAGSSFKTSRYDRNNLNTALAYNLNATSTLRGCVPWNEAVTTINSVPTPRFAPAAAGTGEIQVRYFRGPRSASDSTVCFFRGEYPSNSNTANFPPRDIAERVVNNTSSTVLLASGYSVGATQGMRYRLQSSFTPKYRSRNTSTAGTEQYVEITLRNLRRD